MGSIAAVRTAAHRTSPSYVTSNGERTDWHDRALCQRSDGEAWFPDKGGSLREAQRVCNGDTDRLPCPVRAECLAYALGHGERFGVWGGVSEPERRRILAGKRPIPTFPPVIEAEIPVRDEAGPRPPTEACANGHPLTRENVVIDERGSRRCGTCFRARQLRKADRRRGRSPVKGVRSLACSEGHRWTAESTSTDSNGYRRCRICVAKWKRDRRAAASRARQVAA